MSVADDQLPPAVIADISALRQLRRAELDALVSHMDALFDGASPKSPIPPASPAPAAPVSVPAFSTSPIPTAAPALAPSFTSATSFSAPAPAPAAASHALAAASAPSTCATALLDPAAAPSIDTVLRSLGAVYEVYIEPLKANVSSLDDFSGMDANAVSDELMRMKVTEVKTHANRMAKALLNKSEAAANKKEEESLRAEAAAKKEEEERLRAEAAAKKMAEEERLNGEADEKRRSQQAAERRLVAAAAAASAALLSAGLFLWRRRH